MRNPVFLELIIIEKNTQHSLAMIKIIYEYIVREN